MTDTLAPDHRLLDDARDRPLPDDLKGLAQSARGYARAELAYQKSRLSFTGSEARSIVVAVVVALVFVFFALMGLVFGLILALAPHLTPWGSTAVVVGVLLAVAVIAVLRALKHWRRLSAGLSDAGLSDAGPGDGETA